ncbi:MAG: efflux RND transporter permease subunit [Gammaproteobacteria bacterium]
MLDTLTAVYDRLVLKRPLWAGLLILLMALAALHQAQQFKLDASSDSLILEGDEDLAYFREVSQRYGAEEFLIVTYTPSGELFADATLTHLKRLRDELEALPRVTRVTSILDVPLLDSPRMTLTEVQTRQRKLLDPDVDRDLARREFQTSPLYRDLVMNPEGTTTAMLVSLRRDEPAAELLQRREALRSQRDGQGLNSAEAEELERVSTEYAARSAALQAELQGDIARVRAVLDRYRDQATIFLGGVPMIASDMIEFVRADIETFGIGVGLFIVLLLAISFRRLRWVLVPSAICAIVALVMVGFLGFMDWRVTVVSSNFISLILIITLSLVIHLVVRHRELHQQFPDRPQLELLRETAYSKFKPSLYTALTTMVSFASLIVSGIRPVIDFGLMMVFGCLFAFLLTFLVFPAALARFSPGAPPGEEGRDLTARINLFFARLVEDRPRLTYGLFALLIILGLAGISRLTVENRFIDYFKSDTEIYQGMVLIDRELGGTTPLDVILDPPAWFREEQAEAAEFAADYPQLGSGGLTAESYWYNSERLPEIERIHDYLDSLPATGKVLSLATTMRLIEQLNNDEPPGDLVLSVMYRMLPDDIRATLFDPYMAADGNQLRFAVRVVDSDPTLRRDELLRKIRTDLVEQLELEPEQVQLSGMLVLYNNVIQSLFRSQILTLGVVFAAIALMFWMLFASLKMALIGVAPTLVAAGMILGLMGGLGIPLDIMTITIAAITIGIGVHDTIHYTHRFKTEVQTTGTYEDAVKTSHASVGRAMFYTTVVVTLGFSILALSNFIPTIYFGLFTGVAMIFALISNLTLLPLLLMWLRPFSVERSQ